MTETKTILVKVGTRWERAMIVKVVPLVLWYEDSFSVITETGRRVKLREKDEGTKWIKA